MAYTTIDKPSDYFETILWSSVDTSITGLDFQPDWVWIKSRTNADTHVLFDSVRGTGKRLSSSGTTAEQTKTDELTAFNSDGFTIGTGDNVNRASNNYVAWNWKAGGSASSNSDGSITSTVSANTTSGFSIVTWTAGSGVGSIGHGLGVAPSMIIVKGRSTAIGWVTGLKSNGWNNYLQLQSSNANNNDQRMFTPSGESDPTSTVWYQDHAALGSSGDTMVGYVFAEKKGYSKFGSFTGNSNADGTFVFCGFRPAWILVRNVEISEGFWVINDNKRNTFNPNSNTLVAQNNNSVDAGTDRTDFLSNGFKLRTTSGSWNGSGNKIIYMAFAESPLVNSNGVPNNAR
mgnify:CR=1 FL=1